MSLSDLFSKRLLLVSGKGGVGKTTVSLALGLLAASAGKKVIVAEINSEESVTHLLGHAPIGYRETELFPNLWGINIHPNEAFREYVLMQIRLKSLYRAVFENRMVRSFIEGTPGLSDLMCIGKVYALLDHYDLTIVDAPASGHNLALLQIPSIVSSAVRLGPLKTEAGKIEKVLRDPNATSIACVALPEEMPVTETIELSHWLKQTLGLPIGPLFMNQVHESPVTIREWEEIRDWAPEPVRLQVSRSVQSAQFSGRLQKAFPKQPLVPIPFLYSARFGLPEIETIAEAIQRGLG